MSGPIIVRHAVDTWVNEERPTINFNQKPKLWLRNAASHHKYGYLYFNKPWPSGATITSAKLRVFAVQAWTGATTLTAERPAQKWGINRYNYNKAVADGITGSAASVTTAGSTAADAMIEIDVTSLVQSVANGAPWYGFRLRTSQTVDTSVHSQQALRGSVRPVLIVSWSDAPDQPDGLRPGGGRSITTTAPLLSWNFSDVSGDQNLANVQVQTGTSEANVNAGTVVFDSGTVAASEPQLDLSTTAFTPMTAGQSVWWRARNQDGSGLWSPWSDAVNMVQAAKGVLTITAPTTTVIDGSPTVSWTFTGQTQKSYQVIVAKSTDPNNWLWDSGKITSSATSVGVPFGEIVDAMASYVFKVRIWDNLNRESIPNDVVYVEATTAAIPMAYDVSTVPVTSLAFVSDPILPIGHLTWTKAATPDVFQIQRSDDNGTTWYFLDEKTPAEVLVSGTNYAYDDMTSKRYVTHTYRVISVVSGKMSSSNPTVNGSVQRPAPILMRPDATDACCFLNPERDRERFGVQGVLEPMVGPPVLITQRVGGQGGNVRGRFVDGTPAGYTAKGMRKSFLAMEADSGQKMILGIADETLYVVCYDFNLDVVTDTSGITYDASFKWIEVGP